MTRDVYDLFAPGAMLLAVACAQEPAGRITAPAPPAVLDVSGQAEGTWRYELVGSPRGRSRFAFTVSRLGSGAERSWRAVSSSVDPERRRTVTDTLYLAADGVTPVRRSMWRTLDGRPIRNVTMTYGAGTVETVQNFPGHPDHQTTRRISFADTVAPLMTPVHGPGWGFANLVRLLPLHEDWKGSVYTAPSDRIESLHVVGQETIRVPAGVFDCWRIRVLSPGFEEWLILWVGKSPRQLVRAVIQPDAPGRPRPIEFLLVSSEPS